MARDELYGVLMEPCVEVDKIVISPREQQATVIFHLFLDEHLQTPEVHTVSVPFDSLRQAYADIVRQGIGLLKKQIGDRQALVESFENETLEKPPTVSEE